MKEPQTWYDKSLLDYEPFLSSFKARQLAAPPTRGTENDNDARNDAVVKTLEEMNLVSLSISIYVLQSTSQITVKNGASLA